MEPIRLKEETVALLNRRSNKDREEGCQLCKRILESLGPQNELRNWPPGSKAEKVEMPVEGQRNHVQLELGACQS